MTLMDADPRLGLRDAVVRLLRAGRRDDLARIVASAVVEVNPSGEEWSIGDRRVDAQRLAFVLEPESYALLYSRPENVRLVHEAVASVVRSFATELAQLAFFVRIDAPGTSWGNAYRTAPIAAAVEPPADAVHEASVALAEAFKFTAAAALLRRAVLEVGRIGEEGSPLRRWLVRLEAADFAATSKDPKLTAQIEGIVRSAAAGATVQVGEVSLGVRLEG